jgi:hypothetical protein
VWEGAIPAGATHIRVRLTAYTSGTGAFRIHQSSAQYEPAPTVTVAGSVQLTSGATRIGSVRRSGVWWNDSTAALAASGSITGASRDLVGAATGAVQLDSTPEEFRALSVSDVSGTLHLEVSTDSATWRRIASRASTQVGGSGLHTAELNVKPVTRYARVVYVNDATAQAHFMLQTLAI